MGLVDIVEGCTDPRIQSAKESAEKASSDALSSVRTTGTFDVLNNKAAALGPLEAYNFGQKVSPAIDASKKSQMCSATHALYNLRTLLSNPGANVAISTLQFPLNVKSASGELEQTSPQTFGNVGTTQFGQHISRISNRTKQFTDALDSSDPAVLAKAVTDFHSFINSELAFSLNEINLRHSVFVRTLGPTSTPADLSNFGLVRNFAVQQTESAKEIFGLVNDAVALYRNASPDSAEDKQKVVSAMKNIADRTGTFRELTSAMVPSAQ